MSNRFGLNDFGRRIPLQSVTAWLTRNGWSVVSDNRGGLLCKGPPDDKGNPITCTLPEYESYRDYELRLEDLIATVTVIQERPAIEIVNEMLVSAIRPSNRLGFRDFTRGLLGRGSAVLNPTYRMCLGNGHHGLR
jgi:hypothetical protein